MKKIVLLFTLICSIFKLYSQDILLNQNFNGLTIGNLAADVTGNTPGQGGWFTFASTGATDANFKIVNESAGDNALQIAGNSGASATTGNPSKTRWAQYDLSTNWTNRTSGNNVLYAEFIMTTGSATTSLNNFNVAIFSTDNINLGGFNYNANTRALSGIVYKSEQVNNVATPGTYQYFLGASSTVLTLNASSEINLGLSYNKTTGEFSLFGEGAGASVFYYTFTGAAIGKDIQDLNIYVTAGGSTNAASNSLNFDDFKVEARCATFPPIPKFTAIAPVCSGSPITLLTSSTDATPIVGTWSPNVNNTASTTYTFTPNAGVCASTTTMKVDVNQPVTPTFTAIPTSICLNSTSYSLPTSSSNTPAITGTWSPSINNTTATPYTFTPTAGQCAVNSAPVTISIDQPIVPTFASVSDFCAGTSAPSFPVSNNSPSIPGTWTLNGSPVNAISNVNATNAQITNVYSFVPATGQCATTNVTLSVKVNPSITPTFATSSSVLCSGDVPPSLPSPTNSPTINGIWSPSTIVNTNITNAPVVSTYTFTASGGNCVSNGTYSVTVNPKSTPTFSIATSICSGTTAPTLPTTSNNSIQGSWIPSTVSNTQQGTYEFTPSSCASKVSVTVTINTTPTSPSFDVVQPICMGATAPTLPTTSINSISGSWSPAQVSNLATKIYTFTPTTACSSPTTLMVTVTPNIVPSFTIASSICSGAAVSTLATTSNESVPGTWNPSVISNTTSGNYLFTPTTGVCASPKTVTVTVSPNVAPTFTLPALICTGAMAPVLPSVSTNYITGTWSPSTVSNSVTSTTSYTFTPAAGLCATSTATAIIVSSCAGIDETSTKVFSIYPNPANDFISVTFSDLTENNGTILLLSADGKVVETRNYSNASVETFDVKSLNSGVYFFQIGNTTEKVIIK